MQDCFANFSCNKPVSFNVNKQWVDQKARSGKYIMILQQFCGFALSLVLLHESRTPQTLDIVCGNTLEEIWPTFALQWVW